MSSAEQSPDPIKGFYEAIARNPRIPGILGKAALGMSELHDRILEVPSELLGKVSGWMKENNIEFEEKVERERAEQRMHMAAVRIIDNEMLVVEREQAQDLAMTDGEPGFPEVE